MITNNWYCFSISYLDRYFHLKELASVIYDVIIAVMASQCDENTNKFKY